MRDEEDSAEGRGMVQKSKQSSGGAGSITAERSLWLGRVVAARRRRSISLRAGHGRLILSVLRSLPLADAADVDLQGKVGG